MSTAIAIVGLACRYPDARTPQELWGNVLAQRRSFRRIPDVRLNSEDYVAEDAQAPDKSYGGHAAVIEGYEFDRVAFRVAGSVYRSADLTHWLALDVASQALADAGYGDGRGLPVETAGVVLGNTLTGEFSRASLMRLRWPYVRRVLEPALADRGWSSHQTHEFLELLEPRYKAPFAPVGEETLAGGLSNTIAGRICNHFNLKGGGYTIDGACASSLLAVINACRSLAEGDLDVAVAGGVDLSLDPFELVGFAKTGALAPDLMRIYDVRSNGFWPGEGCGFTVLMREADAVAEGRRIYALIRGWGVSSDGSGGITRPEAEGHILALRRAYRRAGSMIRDVQYFEGHGTGTSVGDATELAALRQARAVLPGGGVDLAAIGSIKSNIGHTKAAAGVAGLIKAVMAVHSQTIPPITGCDQPHPEFTNHGSALRIVREPENWPTGRPLLAGVSAMGFGGINTHVVIEGGDAPRRGRLSPHERALGAAAQDAELFVFAAETVERLKGAVGRVLKFASKVSWAELADLGAELSRAAAESDQQRIRAAVVAGAPAELSARLAALNALLEEGVESKVHVQGGVFLGRCAAPARVGFLFPGQGSPARLNGGIFTRRFGEIRELFQQAELPDSGDGVATEVAQPALAAASAAGLRLLAKLGISADVAVGHSLGELAAFHWAGVFDEAALIRIARRRGEAMGRMGSPSGAMAAIGASPEEVTQLLNGDSAAIAGFNSPRQTVVSGDASAVDAFLARAIGRGWRATRLATSRAFHTPLVAQAAPVLARNLAEETFKPPTRRIISTIVARPLRADDDLRQMLCRQVTSPVRFMEAVTAAAQEADLLIEAGAGQVLASLAAECVTTPAVALDVGGPSLRGLLNAAGAAYVLGVPVQHRQLFEGRDLRPFCLDWQPKFFTNPCELAPARLGTDRTAPQAEFEPRAVPTSPASPPPDSALELVRRLVAERAELPPSAVKDTSRMLSDLHLNSITVGQLAADAARRLHLPPPLGLTDLANATIAEMAAILATLQNTKISKKESGIDGVPAGVDAWVRPFGVRWIKTHPTPSSPGSPAESDGRWRIFAPPGHPLAGALSAQFAQAGGEGVLACLHEDADETCIPLLIESAHAAIRQSVGGRFVLVQRGRGAASIARTLHLEAPGVHVCAIDVPFDHPGAASWVHDEALAARGFVEVRYNSEGARFEPRLSALEIPSGASGLPLGPGDVLLVSGGGKGIAAECALALAKKTGVRLALIGRSPKASDSEVSANLARMAAAGVHCRYETADVADRTAVGQAVAAVERALGPVTAILHAAGNNSPKLISELGEEEFSVALAPKIKGLQNLLAALDPSRLRWLLSFSSIIGRTGLAGEAHYALANEWLSHFTAEFGGHHPRCRCLSLEWSVWTGVGMGVRMGRIESLRQQGITPITPEAGIEALEHLLAGPSTESVVVVTGRLGTLPTAAFIGPTIEPRRFLEKIRVHYPGVEIVAEATLSCESDPYVEEHVLDGNRLFPAVMGLEAMAQVAMALVGGGTAPDFERVEFNRPVVVAADRPSTIRLAALLRAPGVVEVSLRTEETGFQIDHFRAFCRFGEPQEIPPPSLAARCPADLNIAEDVYGDLLFHAGRFRRIQGFQLLRAKECIVDVLSEATSPWFAAALPPVLSLGDPSIRDAALHSIQACIPNARILPVYAGRILRGGIPFPGAAGSDEAASLIIYGRERSQNGDEFIWDIHILRSDGAVMERWEEVRLRKVGDIPRRRPWPVAVLSPLLERSFEEHLGENAPRALLVEGVETEAAVRTLCGDATILRHRSDGKPEVSNPWRISIAHAGNLTLVVAGQEEAGCDLEMIVPRTKNEWLELLGTDRFRLAGQLSGGSNFDEIASGLWNAIECLKKAGLPAETPLTGAPERNDGWREYKAGEARCLISQFAIQGQPKSVSVGLLTRVRSFPEAHSAGGRTRPAPTPASRSYEFAFTVSFEDTNVVGNVYFANYIRWQGRVREQFLADHAPGVLADLRTGLELVTLSVDCRFISQLFALDKVIVRMTLGDHSPISARMLFEYFRVVEGTEVLAAVGSQEIAACRAVSGRRESVLLPEPLREALEKFRPAHAP